MEKLTAKQKAERTKEILKELRKTKEPCRVIQVDFKKREVVGVHICNVTPLEKGA